MVSVGRYREASILSVWPSTDPLSHPREVKIGVVGEVYDSVVVGAGEIGYLYSAFVVEVVDRFAAEFGRIASLACRRGVGEYHTVGLHARGPYLVLKSARTAVQMVDAVVAGQNVLLAAAERNVPSAMRLA